MPLSVARALLLALSPAMGAGCGSEVTGPTMVTTDVLAVVVAEPERWEVVREPEGAAVEARTVQAQRGLDGDHSLLPALVLPPGAEVLVKLDGLPEGAELDFAIGFGEESHELAKGGHGPVRDRARGR